MRKKLLLSGCLYIIAALVFIRWLNRRMEMLDVDAAKAQWETNAITNKVVSEVPK